MSDEQVIAAGCRYFVRHGTIDMDALAAMLAVSRATLYRVINSRDRLVGEVLWRLAECTMESARAARTRYGVEGVLEVFRAFSDSLLDSAPFRRFLANEPEVATRVLFTPAGGVHRRAAELVKEIFDEARPPEGPWIVGDRDNLAFLVMCLAESPCFAELIMGTPPDRELTERTTRALIEQACMPRASSAMRVIPAVSVLIWTSLPAVFCQGLLTTPAIGGA